MLHVETFAYESVLLNRIICKLRINTCYLQKYATELKLPLIFDTDSLTHVVQELLGIESQQPGLLQSFDSTRDFTSKSEMNSNKIVQIKQRHRFQVSSEAYNHVCGNYGISKYSNVDCLCDI